jgi:hypothetical protein
MILQWIRPVKDQARLVSGQYVDRHAPRLVTTIDYPNLQMRCAQVILTLEDIDSSSQDSVMQHDCALLVQFSRFIMSICFQGRGKSKRDAKGED